MNPKAVPMNTTVGDQPEPGTRVALPLLGNADIGQRAYPAPACKLGRVPRQNPRGWGAAVDRYVRRLHREGERSAPPPRAAKPARGFGITPGT